MKTKIMLGFMDKQKKRGQNMNGVCWTKMELPTRSKRGQTKGGSWMK